jgi:hypothetical protein
VDIGDQRFEALFTSPDYALDPTDPRFKAGEGAKSIQQETAKRRGSKPSKVLAFKNLSVPESLVESGEAVTAPCFYMEAQYG